MKSKKPSIVVIGGGTGTFAVLSALKEKDVDLTALMTMVDDGGSNKTLRDEFGLLPTSGIRQAIVALSENQPLMRELFMYRFHQGSGISGMTFGNLFMAAMSDILGSQEKAIEETEKFLSVKGSILPISFDDVQLVATYIDGTEVVGEHHIDEPQHDGRLRITQLRTQPASVISDKARIAILNADMIIMGPGDFYTNTVANLVVDGVVDAIRKSKACVVFIMNLMTKYGEAYDYKASDYILDMNQYLPISRLNAIIMNNDYSFPQEALRQYEKEHSKPVKDDLSTAPIPHSISLIRKQLLSQEIAKPQKGDTVKRSMIRHDAEKIGNLIWKTLASIR